MTFTIQGNVVEDPTGTPIEGVRVEAGTRTLARMII